MALRSIVKTPVTGRVGAANPPMANRPKPGKIDAALPNAKKPYDPKMPDVAEPKEKAVSIRLTSKHKTYLDEIMEILDCDRSEAMRRAIRIFRLGLNGYNAVLVVKDQSGEDISVIPVMTNGIPI